MGKEPRSPMLGYNHNVQYGGRLFHVQTEDSGPGNPHLLTHLYSSGTVLASKRHEYDPEAPEDVVRALMQAQHKAMLKELKQAKFDARIAKVFPALPATAPPPPQRKVRPTISVVPDNPARPAPALVVVQRTVIVGGSPTGGPDKGASQGTPGPTQIPQRKSTPSVPFVVREGSHPVIAAAPPRTAAGKPSPAPAARPLVPTATKTPPRTAAAPAPTPQARRPADVISDKSLDEVILSYLAQDEPKKR